MIKIFVSPCSSSRIIANLNYLVLSIIDYQTDNNKLLSHFETSAFLSKLWEFWILQLKNIVETDSIKHLFRNHWIRYNILYKFNSLNRINEALMECSLVFTLIDCRYHILYRQSKSEHQNYLKKIKMTVGDEILDNIIRQMGGIGKQQIIVLGCLTLIAIFHSATHIAYVFTSMDTDYRWVYYFFKILD